MSKMWEVDPETKSKLQDIAKTNDNNRCIDCGAPSPQWASPKLGIFFCLACSGIHRSLGVHISFVRSCTMDAFKTAEVKRMSLGGNKPFIDFFNHHASNTPLGTTFDQCTISERYDSEAGEEWKERLTCKVEEREYVPGTTKRESRAQKTAVGELPGSSTPSGTSSPSRQGAASPSQKTRNEAYFARQGAVNASRPSDLPPSQGGKFSGFGSSPPPSSNTNSGVPNANEFQADPVAALTKGFGWLSSNLTKQAATVNRSYIQPGIKDFASSDFAAQARQVGTNLGSGVQQGARGLGDQFQKFVDPETGAVTGGQRGAGPGAGQGPEKRDFWDSFGQDPAGPPREKKDFWDDFAAAGEERQGGGMGGGKPKSVGTSAMKTGSGSGAGGAAAKKEEGDGWGDW